MVNFAYIVSNLITLAISVAQIKATLIVPKLKLRASELTNLILSTLFIVYCYYKDRAIVFFPVARDHPTLFQACGYSPFLN